MRAQLEAALGRPPARDRWTLARTDRPTRDTRRRSALLRCAVRTRPDAVGRAFSGAAVELALAVLPGLPRDRPARRRRPRTASSARRTSTRRPSTHTAVLPDGTRVEVVPDPTELVDAVADDGHRGRRRYPAAAGRPDPPAAARHVRRARTRRQGRRRQRRGVGRARDAGPTARVTWLATMLTRSGSAQLLPEAADLDVDVTCCRTCGALNFVVDGLLGEGVSPRTRVRPAGQGARRVAALPARRHPGGARCDVLDRAVTRRAPSTRSVGRRCSTKLARAGAPSTPRRWRAAGRSTSPGTTRAASCCRASGSSCWSTEDTPFLELSPLAAWGSDFTGRRQRRHRHRRGRGRRVPDHRQRPDGARRRAATRGR